MFAVRDNRTGKFLKAFNGSFNRASFGVQYNIAEEMLGSENELDVYDHELDVFNKLKDVSQEQIIERMWCLKTPNGGQLYKSEGAVVASIGHRDWIEIVPVRVVEDKRRKKNVRSS